MRRQDDRPGGVSTDTKDEIWAEFSQDEMGLKMGSGKLGNRDKRRTQSPPLQTFDINGLPIETSQFASVHRPSGVYEEHTIIRVTRHELASHFNRWEDVSTSTTASQEQTFWERWHAYSKISDRIDQGGGDWWSLSKTELW